ncbi:hypothetical protein [Butyrivibrio sp. FCS006]|uniref:hypothetical protein n=1 Tax=Butyrivibrio sp. FCS006 TaxID=1280684 RepID=UPI000423F974|nr:hypothetical protein [Butyrivibrio sp. FCS006]
MSNILEKVTSVIFHVMLALIIVLLLFADSIPYNEFHKRTFVAPNYILLPLGVAVLFGIKYLITIKFYDVIKPWILIVIMFTLSVIVAFGAMFITGWDAGVVTNDAMHLALGEDISVDYYSLNPNNRLILLILTAIFRLGIGMGLSTKTALYGCAVLFTCIVFWLTGILLYDYLQIQHGKRVAVFGLVLYIIFISASPWIFIVYTDSLGILFPMLVIWLFCRLSGSTWWKSLTKWALIVLVSVIGYYMKAPTFIVLIAVILRIVIVTISDFGKKKFISGVANIIVVAVSCMLLLKAGDTLLDKSFENITGIERDDTIALSAWHYLMMGHNYEKDGTVNNDDLTLSMYISDPDERVSRNKSEFEKRVKNLWPDKLLFLYGRKLTMNYNDGSFGYALTGADFISDPLEDDSAINTWIRYFYRPSNGGSDWLFNIEQTIWLGILSMAFCSGIRKQKNRSTVIVVYIALMGATAFVTLFEAQARYLLIWAPLYVLLAATGLEKQN